MTNDERAFLDNQAALRAQAAQIEALRAALNYAIGKCNQIEGCNGYRMDKNDEWIGPFVYQIRDEARKVLEATK